METRAGNVGPGWDLAAEGKAKNKIKQRDLPLLPHWSILVGVYKIIGIEIEGFRISRIFFHQEQQFSGIL